MNRWPTKTCVCDTGHVKLFQLEKVPEKRKWDSKGCTLWGVAWGWWDTCVRCGQRWIMWSQNTMGYGKVTQCFLSGRWSGI